jgi:hypothetical protein
MIQPAFWLPGRLVAQQAAPDHDRITCAQGARVCDLLG